MATNLSIDPKLIDEALGVIRDCKSELGRPFLGHNLYVRIWQSGSYTLLIE